MSPRELLVTFGSILPRSIAARLASDSFITRAVRPIVNRLVPDSPRIVTIIGGQGAGLKLMIEPRKEKFYWTGLHERHVQDAIVANLNSNDIFWDIGSHIGFMCLIAARRVGPTGAVHAFEPMSENRERLSRSVTVNRLGNVTIHSAAVDAMDGEAILHSHPSSLMWSLDISAKSKDGELVERKSLDGIAASLAEPPNLIKIDTEGLELNVIRGGVRLLEEHKPRLIVEFHDENRVDAARAMLRAYDFRHLGRNHWLLIPSE